MVDLTKAAKTGTRNSELIKQVFIAVPCILQKSPQWGGKGLKSIIVIVINRRVVIKFVESWAK